MRDKPTAREVHGQHLDERNRVRQLERHEISVRERERARMLTALGVPLIPEPAEPDVFCEGSVI